MPLWLLLVTIAVAAIACDRCGYLIGRAAGPTIFERPGTKRPGPAQLARAKDFFAKHGPRTVVLARFVPIVRTITPSWPGLPGCSTEPS